MTSDGETTKTKVVDPEKLYNFAVDDIFIWICLDFQTLILKLVEHNMRRNNTWYRQSESGVECLEGGTCKTEVAGLKPSGRVACDFHAKNGATCDRDGAGVWLPGGAF